MSELRYNPLLDTYVMVAANRQNRPNLPKDWCPFCPGQDKKVPNHYDVFNYPNDFPVLSNLDAPAMFDVDNESDLYQKKNAIGGSEVILYTSKHEEQFYNLLDEHVLKLIDLWIERFNFYKKYDEVKYVFLFENKGEAVGVTMHHPHGQLYAYPFIPLKIKTELINAKKYYEKHHVNLFDEILNEELKNNQRIIFENDTFVMYLPFFTDYPYGVFIQSKKDKLYISDFNNNEQKDLVEVLKNTTGMFDSLFDKSFPYMMCMHQGAINDEEFTETQQRQFYRFHIEFYPPLRNENTIKYYASSEMGAWAAANTRAVEDTAVELKNALNKYQLSSTK
ncbi:MAG: galactose-1-phosphate uridylyltransferase [Chitinophagales bacterium]|nr:galactose-1-phosphate uridylyltransferase [Chitinophagales bacterium]